MTETPFNPLREDEQNAGPAIGYENRLDQVIGRIIRGVLGPREKTVFEHEMELQRDTGPKRTGENKNDRKRRRRQK